MADGRGYFQIATIRGVPVLVHWSFPLGGLLISFIGHAPPQKWLSYCIAYTALIAIHESGHVLAAVALRLRVFSVEISGVGGLCRFERPRHIWQSALVYTAGLTAQAITFALTLAYVMAHGTRLGNLGWALYITFTYVNVALFALNLIPRRDTRSGLDTDGLVLWRLFLHKFKGHPHPHPPLVATPADQAPVFPPDTRLLQMPGFRPPGFVHGIEVLSDRTTPMDFVVSSLMAHLQLSKEQAIVTMLDIHNIGGMLIPLPTAQEADRVANAMAAEALAAGHQFTCRYAGGNAVDSQEGTP